MSDSPTDRPVLLAPSILASDFGRLAEEIGEAVAGGADWIHVDVMDGRFVPNISIGVPIVEACRRATEAPLDVHLMIAEPERYLDAFADAGADGLTLHAEATPHVQRALQRVRERGLRAGLALNPATPLEWAREALPYCDLVLVMSVNPGFGGQRFLPTTPERLERVARWRDETNPECRIEVDGGITADTAPAAVAAGADVLVAGSAVFGGAASVGENLARLRAAARA